MWKTDKEFKEAIGSFIRERRFLAHGFVTYCLPKETITTYVKETGRVIKKNQTLADIKGYTNRLHHLNTGDNGINGEFNILFTKTRINKRNILNC